MNTEQGIIIGQDGTVFTVDIVVVAGSNKVNAATFEMNMVASANANVFAFIAFPNIGDINVSGASLTADHVGIPSSDFNLLFNQIFQNAATVINSQYNVQGYPLANIDPTIGMLSGLLQQFTVSATKADEFLLIGWSMYADLPTLADYGTEHRQFEPVVGATYVDNTGAFLQF